MKNDFSLECLSDGQQVYCTAGDRALVTWWMYMVHHFKRLKIPLKGTRFVFPCSVSCLVSTGSIALWASCSELLGGHGLCTFCSCMLQKKAKLTAALDWLGGHRGVHQVRAWRCQKRTVTKCSLGYRAHSSTCQSSTPEGQQCAWAAHPVRLCSIPSVPTTKQQSKHQHVLLPKPGLPVSPLHKHSKSVRIYWGFVAKGYIFQLQPRVLLG